MDTAARPNPAQSDRDRIVKLADSGSLIAAIPPMLGFHPQDSLVVVTLQDDLITGVARMDLVAPSMHGALATAVIRATRQYKAQAAVLVVVCERPDPRHDELVQRAVAALADISVPVPHVLWAPSTSGGVPWRCYLHHDCEGEVPDSAASELAAEVAASGLVTYDRREDLDQLFQPPDTDRMIKLSSLIDTSHPLRPHHQRRTRAGHSRRHQLRHPAHHRRGVRPPRPGAVRLPGARPVPRLRTRCPDRHPPPRRLWLELARRLPPPTAPRPAVLLAVCAYMRGDGALANVALEQARSALPGHELAGLPAGAVATACPARTCGSSCHDAAVDARIDIEGDSDTPEGRRHVPLSPPQPPAGRAHRQAPPRSRARPRLSQPRRSERPGAGRDPSPPDGSRPHSSTPCSVSSQRPADRFHATVSRDRAAVRAGLNERSSGRPGRWP